MPPFVKEIVFLATKETLAISSDVGNGGVL